MEQATYAQRNYLRVLLGEEPRDGLTKQEASEMIQAWGEGILR